MLNEVGTGFCASELSHCDKLNTTSTQLSRLIFRKNYVSTLSVVRADVLAVTTSPAVEKTFSLGTEVPEQPGNI